MIFLYLDDLLHVAERTLGSPPVIRDRGLLEAALARPRASAWSQDAYPTIHEKVAALLHSAARSHALLDGNKRLALAAAIAFYGINGFRLELTNEQAYSLVIRVARGELDDVPSIARELRQGIASQGAR